MILTPTYRVFEMYKVHQDAALLPTELQCVEHINESSGEARRSRFGIAQGEEKTPALNVSASKDKSLRELVVRIISAPPVNQFLKLSHFQESPTK